MMNRFHGGLVAERSSPGMSAEHIHAAQLSLFDSCLISHDQHARANCVEARGKKKEKEVEQALCLRTL